MATLNTLRTKYGIILSVVIALVLVAFILGDQLSMQNRQSEIPTDKTVMTVNGEEVKASQYAEHIDMFRQANMSEDSKSDYARESVVFDLYAAPALDAAGLGVADGDVRAYAGIFATQFAEMYRMYGWPEDQIAIMAQNQWVSMLPTIGMNLGYQKFSTAYAAANYVNRLEVEHSLRNNNLTFDGRYVMVPFRAMPEVTITDEEVDAYYEANKSKNINYGARTLRYVTFEIAPTAEDLAAVEQQIMDADAAVAAANGDTAAIKQAVRNIGGRVDTYKLYSSLDANVAAAFAKGENYGPLFENNTWTASYLVCDVVAPATYEFEVAVVENVVLANELVEKLQAVEGDFTKLEEAVETSADSRQMVSMTEGEAKDFIGKKVGDIFVTTYNHQPAVAKITSLGDAQRFVITADVNRVVNASELTNRNIVSSVEQFVADAGNSVEKFDEAANNAHYQILVTTANRNDYLPMQGRTRGVRGIVDSRNIAVWAYGAQVGDIKYFHAADAIHVVMVASIDENEYEAKNDNFIRMRLMRDKQYEAIASQLAMGAEIEGAESGTFTGVKFADTNVDGNWDAAFVGAVARCRETGVEVKVKGSNAAYVFVVDAINGEVDLATIDAERIPEMTQRESAMGSVAIDVLNSKVVVEDFRSESEI